MNTIEIGIKKYSFMLLFLIFALPDAYAQEGPEKKLSFTGDFRFRIEEDWNSRKSDGTYRDDRTRLRYRARVGMNYKANDWASFGIRIRTGDPDKQQDPNLTLGQGFDEFSSLPIAFETLFFRAQYKWLDAWVGKNAFSFEKQNELFWSDNVFPEGIFVSAFFELESNWIQSMKFSAAHYVMRSNNSSLNKDSYIQVIQATTKHWSNRLTLFPTFYYFNKMPNIPDGNDTYQINYSIAHLGTKVLAFEKQKITVGLDLYQNLENYQQNDSIPDSLKDQKKGIVGSLIWGNLKKKGDFRAAAYYTYLERYAAVDFLAQNDWARWDYRAQGSPDGRVTNFKGLEIAVGYRINKNMTLKMRYFRVNQLIPYGEYLENGNRIRLDLDIGF
jgi:hypothetical protein